MLTLIFAKIQQQVSACTPCYRFFLSFLMVVVICIGDVSISYTISLSSFYALPVLFTTWFSGTRYGLIISCLSFFALMFTHWVYQQNGIVLLDWFGYSIFALGAIINQLILLTITHFVRKKMTELIIWSDIDSLTKIANRRAFLNTLELEFERAKRYGHPFAVAFLDLDNFKHMNDTFGHNVGDLLLQAVADTMKAHSRASDTVARLGGDEFAVLITETDPEQAAMVLSKISTAIREDCKARDWPVGVSLGSVCFMQVPENAEVAVKMADELMYEVKKSNKNQDKHHVFTTKK